ncbi:hypothetical protein SAMN02982994_4875 [Azospirillum lipoferum]|nr:hypothetical protein SAMN02982994_4875 [Azospirillum lipoferum]
MYPLTPTPLPQGERGFRSWRSRPPYCCPLEGVVVAPPPAEPPLVAPPGTVVVGAGALFMVLPDEPSMVGTPVAGGGVVVEVEPADEPDDSVAGRSAVEVPLFWADWSSQAARPRSRAGRAAIRSLLRMECLSLPWVAWAGCAIRCAAGCGAAWQPRSPSNTEALRFIPRRDAFFPPVARFPGASALWRRCRRTPGMGCATNTNSERLLCCPFFV